MTLSLHTNCPRTQQPEEEEEEEEEERRNIAIYWIDGTITESVIFAMILMDGRSLILRLVC